MGLCGYLYFETGDSIQPLGDIPDDAEGNPKALAELAIEWFGRPDRLARLGMKEKDIKCLQRVSPDYSTVPKNPKLPEDIEHWWTDSVELVRVLKAFQAVMPRVMTLIGEMEERGEHLPVHMGDTESYLEALCSAVKNAIVSSEWVANQGKRVTLLVF